MFSESTPCSAHGRSSPGRRWSAILAVLALLGICHPLLANPQLEMATAPAVTMLYSKRSAAIAGQYAEAVQSIRQLPAIVVMPIDLAFNDTLVAGSTVNLQLANQIAMSEAGGTIAVVYPDIDEPYRSVFTKIIEGIKSASVTKVYSFPVGESIDVGQLSEALKSKQVRVVITLGRRGMLAANSLNREFGVLVGGVVSVPETAAKGLPVVSLSPDPALLFAKLKGLLPKAGRVHVVYDPRQNSWLIDLARKAAGRQGLELVAREAGELKEAIGIYQEILATANPDQDVLWLPHDTTTVDEGVVLPLVLKQAWDRRLAVFSSSFGHVKRGVLFALFPDNLGLGRNLAGSALSVLSKGDSVNHGVSPLTDVQTALNLRIARHLGLNLSRQQERSFDLVFTGQ